VCLTRRDREEVRSDRAFALASKPDWRRSPSIERSAFLATAWRLGRYYRTYPAYVEDEVRAALRDRADFVRGPRVLSKRGTATDDAPALVIEDDNYISARWPGDAYLFAKRFAARLAS
jgi:hypothetical protein